MAEKTNPSEDRYAHLRDYATKQKRATVDRLKQAITQLEKDSRPVTTFTVKEISGLDYMAYYRNAEALALFRSHSTHLRKQRAIAQSKRRGATRFPLESRKPLFPREIPFSTTKSLAWSLNCARLVPSMIKWNSSIKLSCKNIWAAD